MKPLHLRTVISLAVIACGLHGASAVADSGVKTTFSGFGTLVGTVTDNNDVQVISSPFQTKGADKNLDFGGDSRIGLQGRLEFDSALSVTAQVIAQRRVDKDFDPEVEWLFGQWSGIPNLDLRLGRVVLPAFLVSDSRYVTYALPGVRVPTLVYSMFPTSHVDGFQANYRHRTGSVNWTLTGTLGNPGDNPTGASKDVVNVALSAEMGDWTFRYGYVQANARVDLADLGTEVRFRDKFHNLAMQYDNGDFFGTVEYVARKSDPKYLDSFGWYATGGMRFGKWTPYATVSREKMSSDNLPAVQIPVAPGVTFPYVLFKPENNAEGVAVGVRYDVASNIALKAEYGQYKGASPFIFSPSVGSTLTDRETVNTVSVGLDFVF